MSRPYIVSNSLYVTTVAFSQLFKGIVVKNFLKENGRYDDTDAKVIPVDVTLDTKEKIYHYLKHGGHDKVRQADTRLPKIAIQIESMSPALDRYTGKGAKRLLSRSFGDTGEQTIQNDIQPVPFDINYRVSVWCKHMEHWTQIMENILPWFDSYVNVGVKERDLGIEREIKVSLESVSPNFSFAVPNVGNERRLVRSELSFKCETVIYKQKKVESSDEQSNIIKQAFIQLVDVVTPFSSQTIHLSGGVINE